jgi:hypothetical protein
MKSLLRTLLGLGVAASLGLPAASRAQPVVSNDLFEVKAVVESVDLKSRTVLLRGDDGELATIVASPEVHNLPQVHPGDVVLVSVHRSVALQMSRADSVPVNSVEGMAMQAEPGTKPGAFRRDTLQARVQIQGIDLPNRTVSFVGPARILRAVQIKDPKVMEFVRTLHPGDEVDVTYSVGVAASVVPAH